MQLHESIGALRRETELDAPRDAVWPLVAEPDALATWLADAVDLPAVAPGARGTVVEDGEERRVTIEEVQEGRRVALSWCAAGGEPSLVELTLDDLPGGRTRMVVVEIPLAVLRAVASAGVGELGRSHGPQMAAVPALA